MNNRQQARLAGLRVGAYHYFTLFRDPPEQARNFIRTVAVEPDALPPAIDVEFVGNCSKIPIRTDLQSAVRLWVVQGARHFGRPVVLHTTHTTFAEGFEGDALPTRLL